MIFYKNNCIVLVLLQFLFTFSFINTTLLPPCSLLVQYTIWIKQNLNGTRFPINLCFRLLYPNREQRGRWQEKFLNIVWPPNFALICLFILCIYNNNAFINIKACWTLPKFGLHFFMVLWNEFLWNVCVYFTVASLRFLWYG